MIAAICVDDRGGLLFNGRRLSRDRAQREDLLALCGAGRLWMNGFSAPLFAGLEDRIAVDENFLTLAGPGEVCFVEDRPLGPVRDRLEAVVVYRWNRAYPADVHLDLDLAEAGLSLAERREFPGTSHETITREQYRRGGAYGQA